MKVSVMNFEAKTTERNLEIHLILRICNSLKLDYLSNLV